MQWRRNCQWSLRVRSRLGWQASCPSHLDVLVGIPSHLFERLGLYSLRIIPRLHKEQLLVEASMPRNRLDLSYSYRIDNCLNASWCRFDPNELKFICRQTSSTNSVVWDVVLSSCPNKLMGNTCMDHAYRLRTCNTFLDTESLPW
jgi:hypothetical protein